MRFLFILIFTFCSLIAFPQKGLEFTKFQVFDDSTVYDCSKPIQLNYKPQHIGISFKDNDAKEPGEFQIQLNGSDNIEWINIGNQTFMSYANLYGGDYEFRVKNLKTKSENTLKFKIEAAFWQKWWFLPSVLLYILTVMGIITYLFILYRFRQKMKTLKVQDKIARDLHDDVGSTLSSIAILTQAAKNNLEKSPEKTKKLLSQISENAQETLENMSDIVWTNKTLNDNIEQLTIRMNEFLGKVLEPKGIDYKIDTTKNIKSLHWTSQKYYDFYMIFKGSYKQCSKNMPMLITVKVSLELSENILSDENYRRW